MNGTCASQAQQGDDKQLDDHSDSLDSSASTGQESSARSQGLWLDRIAATALLIGLSPFMVIVALLVKTTSRGPIIYRQWRLGKDRKRFQLYKFRTMRVDAESGTGPVWCGARDSRITPVGGILRKLGLDEMPQLINVIKGDMAIVGPRPERPEIADMLVDEIPTYYDRLQVHPGITGLAQVNLPADTDIDSVRRKLQLDLEYIERRTINFDACIFLATTPRVVGNSGAGVVRLLGLARNPKVELSVDKEEASNSVVTGYRPANPR